MHRPGASHPAQPPKYAPPPFPMQHHAPPLYHAAAPMPPPPPGIPVRRVWAGNLPSELRFLRDFSRNARHVAVTVHYPGVVHGPGAGAAGQHHQNHTQMTAEERYAAMKANVDDLKRIQLGLAVHNDYGHIAAWEFNLRGFRPACDAHAPNSVEYLERRGLSFRDHQARGIEPCRLAAGLNSCVLFRRRRRPGISWATYAGVYHVAYLVKILSAGSPLPGGLGGFLDEVRRRLGEDVYDVARMAVDCGLPPGLERVAGALRLVPAALSPRLAGAGSVLALQAFMRLKYDELGGDVTRFRGIIHGVQVV